MGLVGIFGGLVTGLGSDPKFAGFAERRPFSPRVADCQGDEEMVRHEFAAARVSRERGVIGRAGAPISTLARRV